jgi:hypothetical protein
VIAHSDAYRRFLDSTQVSRAGWRDGDGYDLESLAQVEGEERLDAECLLLERIKSSGGWREIESLARLGTPGAKQAIRDVAAADTADWTTRLHAAEQLAEWGEDIQVDRYILPALRVSRMNAAASYALDAAVRFPAAYLRNGLLDLARDGAEEVRPHAAALSLFLAGKSEAPFDWNQRPFFLRFATKDREELARAHLELRELVGAIPE